MQLLFECRICSKLGQKKTQHWILSEFTDLPANTFVVKCLGCGTEGVKLIDSTTLDTPIKP